MAIGAADSNLAVLELRGESPSIPRASGRLFAIFPSRISMRRGVTAAISGSCVTSTMVRPSVAELAEKLKDGFAGMGIEIAGRLVRKNNSWAVDQRPRDGGALLLAARKLAGTMFGAVGHVHRLRALPWRARAVPCEGMPL